MQQSMKPITLGECVVCGKPVIVAEWVAKLAKFPIKTCCRKCGEKHAQLIKQKKEG